MSYRALPVAKRRGFVLTVHLFLDDSGKEGQAGAPIVVLAGYLAHREVLDSLDDSWIQLLIKHGIPEVHMRQLIPIPLTGMYSHLDWDRDHRDAVLGEFIEVINRSAMTGVGIAVKTESWRTYKKKYPDLWRGDIQQFCLERALARVVGRLHDAGIDERLHLMFDTDPEFGVARFKTFCALMGHDPRAARRLMGLTFGHPCYFPSLQCADVLAWETRRELAREGKYQPTRRWQAMFTQMPDYQLRYEIGELWEDEHFEKAATELTEKASRAVQPSP